MAIAINGKIPVELAKPNASLVAGTPEGTLLQTHTDGTVIFGTVLNQIDGILVAEIVDAATAKDRLYIFNDIDYSGYVQAGDYIVVARQFDGLTMNGVALEPPASDIPKGDTLILGTNGRLKDRPGGDTTSATVAIALEPILAGSTKTGTIHFRAR
jgi:hypothetical protein